MENINFCFNRDAGEIEKRSTFSETGQTVKKGVSGYSSGHKPEILNTPVAAIYIGNIYYIDGDPELGCRVIDFDCTDQNLDRMIVEDLEIPFPVLVSGRRLKTNPDPKN